MFETLFTQPSTIESYQAAPLADERERYLRHFAESGAARSTLQMIAHEQRSLVFFLDLTNDKKVTASQVAAAATEWSRPGKHRRHRTVRSSPQTRKLFLLRSLRWLRFIDRLDEPVVVRHPHMAQVAAYEEWMRNERGLSEDTIQANCTDANRFFDWLVTQDLPLSSVTAIDIDNAIMAKKGSGLYSRTTIRHYAKRIHAFFKYAERRDWCAPGVTTALLPRRIYRDETVPPGRTREEVVDLLATTEGDRPVDKRDRAILMLFIAYGLRVNELCNIELDDLDWEKETLRVRRPKPRRTQLYPLSRGVGQAIIRYVVEVRPPRAERALFLTLLAPIRPLSRGGFESVVINRLRRIGVVTGRRGPHTLRHAAAQHLMDQGVPLKVIGDFLGHRDPASTSIYARSDLKTLREVADFDLEGLV